jgi:hypothetical protein
MDRRQNAARRAIRAIIRQTGGIRQAERELKRRYPEATRYPSAGLLTQIREGTRRPQPWLCDLLGIPEPERKPRPAPIPWRRVVRSLVIGPNHLIGILVTHGVDHQLAAMAADKMFKEGVRR